MGSKPRQNSIYSCGELIGLPTDLACFGVKGTDARIYYVTPSNGHVHELAWIGSWVAADLMQSAARGVLQYPRWHCNRHDAT